MIPSVLLGKERSILSQYFVCLVLAFLAFSIQDLLLAYGGVQIQRLFTSATFLNNLVLAVIYLIIPYLVMVGIDIRSRKLRKEKEMVSDVVPANLQPSRDSRV